MIDFETAAKVEKNLNSNMDARAWAKEFIRIFGHRREEIDEALMLGWFANSIMCGFDEAARRQDAKIHKLKSLLLLTDPSVSDQEMNQLSAKQFAEYERWENALP